MGNNWIKEQVQDEHKQSDDGWADIRKAQLAKSGAPRLFAELVSQLQEELAEYRSLHGRKHIESSNPHSAEFTVRCPRYPAITLTVSSARVNDFETLRSGD